MMCTAVGAQGLFSRSSLCAACSLGLAFGRTRTGLVSMGVICRWRVYSECLRQAASFVPRTYRSRSPHERSSTTSSVYMTRGMRANCIVCLANLLKTVKNEGCCVRELVRRQKRALGPVKRQAPTTGTQVVSLLNGIVALIPLTVSISGAYWRPDDRFITRRCLGWSCRTGLVCFL